MVAHVQANIPTSGFIHPFTPIMATMKSRTSPYWPSQFYCSWHLEGVLNNWSERSRLVCSLTWYVCPAHHQAADNPTHRLRNFSRLRGVPYRWGRDQHLNETHTQNVHYPTLCPQITQYFVSQKNFISDWMSVERGPWNPHSPFILIGWRIAVGSH